MSLDYATYTKRGFLFGLALFLVGAVGDGIGPRFLGELPTWEQTAFLGFMACGVLIGFFSVFGFGIFLPLTD